jgi:tRNA A-37 threonylcarbamoyl transferase component Bud32
LPVPAAPDDPLIGTVLLDTYRVARLLGEGGMGRIYEAHHTRLAGKRFAIKVLRSELSSNTQIRARFEREAETIAKVVHPGVLTIQDVGVTERGWPYIVCEHLLGLDLLAYLKRFGVLPSDGVVQIGRAVTEALVATHSEGVIHRDVKPSNVFLVGGFGPLVPEWQAVKLIDFGLSRFVGRDDDLTKAGIVMGTPAYMSPEQATGGETNQLTDVYGVGAVLYAAATGRPPFREETPQQTLLAVMNREPTRPRELNPSIVEGLEVIIQRAMAKRPAERYPNMASLAAALAQLELVSQWAPAPHRHAGADGEYVRRVRLRFVSLGLGAALLLVAALSSALAGLMALKGERFELTGTEAFLVAGLLTFALSLIGVSMRRFERGAWRNTAKLSSWLPRLRAPISAGLVAYGFACLGVRFADDVVAPFNSFGVLGHALGLAWPGWSALFALVALLAALATAIRQQWWQPEGRLRRWVLGPALGVTVAFATVAIARFGFSWRAAPTVLALSPEAALSEASAEGGGNSESQIILDAGVPGLDAGPLPLGAVDAGTPASAMAGDPAVLEREARMASLAAPNAPASLPTLAPPQALTAAVALGPDGLKDLSRTYAKDPEVLKALVLAHASRSSGLADAVRSIEDLLRVSPARTSDADVRFILGKAAASDGDASRAAFRLMGRGMGSAGPDLLYEMMLKKPALSERAKDRLARPSVRKLFSPELAIAYELRFAPSCASRLRLLDRAGQVGDQRSINVLSALVSKPAKCGRRGRPPCFAPCEREAEPLSRSLHAISQRLRDKERAARID